MKSFRNRFLTVTALLLCAFAAAHAELDSWVENIEAGHKLDAVFFRNYVRRPPGETRADLTKLIAQTPAETDLYSLRALEAEQQLDFTAAEADWKQFVALSMNKATANLALADYHHRRLQPDEEILALRAVAASATDDPFKSAPDQTAWMAFDRIAALIDDQAMDHAPEQYQAWVSRYPREPEAYKKACLALIRKKQFAAAESILQTYPGSPDFPTQIRASIAFAQGAPDRALAVYDRAFQPLWSPEIAGAHFTLLKELGQIRQYLDQWRAQAAANPTDLTATARLYHFYRQQNDTPSAVKALTVYAKQKSIWNSAQEREAVARLFEQTNQFDEAARHYHALYQLNNNEAGLAGLANLLLTASEQPMQIGAGSLGFYRDIAQMDQGPGFLNGVLSLLLNSQSPQYEYGREDGQSISYFHRVKASQLVALFEQKFPNSANRAPLRAKLIQAYATYGDADGVITNGRGFLNSYPDAAERTEVALMMADAYTRLERLNDEFAIYQQLLAELSKKADGRPIGAAVDTAGEQPAAEDQDRTSVRGFPEAAAKSTGVRSQDYVRVLDRYLARLVSMKRLTDALTVYRSELARNSGDPGLYERFAAFLDQNKLGADVERTYRDAMQRFPDDKSWTQKLARWYLRQKQISQYAALTREVTRIFSGSDLEQYFHLTSNSSAGAALYLQLNQYAHQRFPHNLTFVRNLLSAYTTNPTANGAAYEALLRQHWFNSPDLRARFFELLSRTKRLDTELATLTAQKPTPGTNAAATRMLAEAEAWKTHFESAAAPFRLLAASYPAEAQLDERAAALHRSLDRLTTAIEIETNLAKADPRNHDPVTRLGEIQADRERFDLAAPYFTRLAGIEPGKPDGYIESATVFWDYYRFTDALQMIEKARQRFNDPSLYAYEAGAIHENQRDYAGALNEYARGAIAEGEGRSRSRLLRLASRPSLAAQAEAITARLGATQNAANISLRIAVLEAQTRGADLKPYLLNTTAANNSPDILALIEQSARTNDLPDVTRAVLEKRLTIIADPAERLRARMELVRFFESQNDTTRAMQIADALYRENPTTLGAIRSTVSFYWRNKQQTKAIDALTAAADRAQQPYQDRFRFEAAQKSIEAAQFDRANALLAALLNKEPYNASYIAANADLLQKRGDDPGLRAYYTAAIQSLRNAPLTADERIGRIASLRRALVPVLVRLKDSPAALDQYIEVLNRFPEDESFTQEVALFAQRSSQGQRLLDYYMKTAAASPKDHRWPLIVSRIEYVYEDLPAALTWLGKARDIRPERTDLLAAKGLLEERLMHFEEALATYKSLFDLSYRNPRWMMKAGEQYLRLNRQADAVAAIRQGWLEGRPETTANYTEAARQAQTWNLLSAARDFTAKGLALTPDHTELLAINGELAAQLHNPLPSLPRGLEPAAHSTIATRWGAAIARYATPEEKATLASQLRPATDKDLATAAGFAALRAHWEPDLNVEQYPNESLIQLEKQRAKFAELALRFENASKNPKLEASKKNQLLAIASQYYEMIASNAAALRCLEQLKTTIQLRGDYLQRYARLMAASPQQASTVVATDPDAMVRDAVANAIMRTNRSTDAMNAVAARAPGLRPVWANAYTSLTALHFGLNTPQIRTAFTALLGPQPVGAQLNGAPDDDQQVTGQAWYYYAARLGEYLTYRNNPKEAESYLLSQLEEAPGDVNAYANLAAHFLEAGNASRALAEYDYVLQLDPAHATAHARKAAILAQQGRIADAVKEWKSALEGVNGDLAGVLADIAQYKAFPQLRDDAAKALKGYFKKNGAYRAGSLIEAAYLAGGLDWLIEVTRAAADPAEPLAAALRGTWLPAGERDTVHARLVELAQARADSALGPDRAGLQEAAFNARTARVQDRLATGNLDGAEALFKQLPRKPYDIEIAIAARRRALGPLLDRYRADPEHAPSMDQLRRAAAQLQPDGADQIMEFVCTGELNNRQFTAANFLGLAEIKLKRSDLPGALELLRRMNLIAGEPFDLLRDSADLLVRTGHTPEANQYKDQLAKVRPWDPQTRLDAKDGSLPYALRVQAAQSAGAAGNSGVPELDLIASHSPITEAQAAKPYFIAARIAAAAASKDLVVRTRLLQQAIAIDPNGAPDLRLKLFHAAVDAKYFYQANAVSPPSPVGDSTETLTALVTVKQRIGDLPSAIRYQLQLIHRLQGTDKAAAEKTLAGLQRELTLQNLNESRRPVISENILPDRIVRPRLSTLPPTEALSKGDEQ